MEVRQSSFKVKAEPVASHYGIPPRPGAILFLKSDHQLIYGDGYNWLDIGPGADKKAALALAVTTPFDIPFVAGVEQQVTFYQDIIYNYKSRFKASGGNLVEIVDNFDVDFWVEYCISCDTPGATLTIESRYNGYSESRDVWLDAKGQRETLQDYTIFTASPLKDWTVWAKADRDCVVKVCTVKMGFHERT